MSDIWIGTFEVLETPGGRELGGNSRAFVNVIAIATSVAEFVELATHHLAEAGFMAFDAEDVTLVASLMEQGVLDSELDELAKSVTPQNPVAFGTFHTFPESE